LDTLDQLSRSDNVLTVGSSCSGPGGLTPVALGGGERQAPVAGLGEALAQQRGEAGDAGGGPGAQGLLWSLLWDDVQDEAQKPPGLPVFCRRLAEVRSVQPIFRPLPGRLSAAGPIPGCTTMQVRTKAYDGAGGMLSHGACR
jgi:hypothetical protein